MINQIRFAVIQNDQNLFCQIITNEQSRKINIYRQRVAAKSIAEYGRTEMLYHIEKEFLGNAIAWAAFYGQLNVLMCAHQLGGDLHKLENHAFYEAIKQSNLQCAQYIWNNRDNKSPPIDINKLKEYINSEQIYYWVKQHVIQ